MCAQVYFLLQSYSLPVFRLGVHCQRHKRTVQKQLKQLDLCNPG